MNTQVWFHVDMDAFYASVEQRNHPEYRGKPLIIGGSPESRGVVSTASYEARAYGVRSAMPTAQAKKLCPNGIFIYGDINLYSNESKIIMAIFSDYSPEVIQVSIDEAFLHMTGTQKLFGEPYQAAQLIQKRVLDQTGLTISIGIGPSKLIAKIASGQKKPMGITQVDPGTEEKFISQLGLKDLWGVGKKTQQRLQDLGILTVEQLKEIPEHKLKLIFGEAGGSYLYRISRGIDPGIYSGSVKSSSMSSETTFYQDIADPQVINQVLLDLSHTLMFRLRWEQLSSNLLFLKIRYSDFATTTIQTHKDQPFLSVEQTRDEARTLLTKRWNRKDPIRLLGLGFGDLKKNDLSIQRDLFGDDEKSFKQQQVEQAVLDLRKKFSKAVVQKASLMKTEEDHQKEGTDHNHPTRNP
jgi:DNA polymerase-4